MRIVSTLRNPSRKFKLYLLRLSISEVKNGLYHDIKNGYLGIRLGKNTMVFEHETERWFSPLKVFEDPRVNYVYLIIDKNTITQNIVSVILDIFVPSEKILDVIKYNIQAINLEMFNLEDRVKVINNITEEHLDKILWKNL